MNRSERNMNIPARTIGIDLGDRSSYFVVLDSAGEILEEGRVKTRMVEFQAIVEWCWRRAISPAGSARR
jgi:predicted NBD/HSP70 family sugar kinase